eukprot:gene11134-12305_t
MDLFKVERYYADDYNEDISFSSEIEKQRLDCLKEKIQRRKSELSSPRPCFVNDDDVESEGSLLNENKEKLKKKKKKKRDQEKSENGNDDGEGEVVVMNDKSLESSSTETEPPPKKKKKKVKIPEAQQIDSESILGQVKKNAQLIGNDIDNKDDENSSEIVNMNDNTECNKTKSSKTKKKHRKKEKAAINDEDNADDDVGFVEKKVNEKTIKNSIATSDEALELHEKNDFNTPNENNGHTSAQEPEYFPILGLDNRKKEKQIVKRTLPKWISEPRLMLADISQGTLPINNVTELAGFMKDNLRENNIEYLFPVQANVIPYILSQQSKGTIYGKGGLKPPDVCVSAPTGSGKTLAYVLPIIQILSQCFVRRLQAIVILPSKDLAVQIKAVISLYVKGTAVRVGLAAGMKSFPQEQEHLVKLGPNGFVNTVDILVCTPGRLVDHIDHTAGFSLEHLRFLIIDEADRLLGQTYHNWLEKIFKAAYKSNNDNSDNNNIATTRSRNPLLTPSSLDRVELPLQKLLFSATLTQNPEKLAPLQLFRPVLFASTGKIDATQADNTKSDAAKDIPNKDDQSNERFILPESLTEKMTVCKQGEKPLAVIYLMKKLQYTRALCFTGSIETTHRLFLLVKASGVRVAEFSSTLNQSQRKGILRDFKAGDIDLLICSDAMSRGIDIDKVHHVISYDPPVNIKTYVHRVGRTARAGQQGTALTILYPKEVFHFKKIIRNGKRTTLQKVNMTNEDFEPFIGGYEEALTSLKDSIETERSQGYNKQGNKNR